MRIVVLLGLLVGISALAGCATMTKTPEERADTYKRVLDTDMRMIADDWDYLWLADRQYRLSRWRVR